MNTLKNKVKLDNIILLKISKLFKQAAFQFTPEMSWVPQEFQDLPPFKEFPHEKAIKEFAKYGLNDFREKIEVDEKYNIEITNFLLNDIIDILDKLNSKTGSGLNLHREQIQNFINALYKIDISSNKKLILPYSIKLNKIQYPAGTSIFKIYQALEPIAQQYNFSLPKLESLQNFKNYSKRPKNFWLVFSTKPEDMIGAAERGISSCQSLFDMGDFNITEANQCLVGNILSKYVGIIYVTSGTDFEGKGEKMLYRSMVRLIKDLEYNKLMIYIDKMYPSTNQDYLTLFRESLEQKTHLPVTWWEEYTDPIKQIAPLEDIEEELPVEYRSYKDFSTLSKLKQWATDEDSGRRKFAAAELPIDSPELAKLLEDEDFDISFMAAERVPLKTLKQFIDKHRIIKEEFPEIIELYKKRRASQ